MCPQHILSMVGNRSGDASSVQRPTLQRRVSLGDASSVQRPTVQRRVSFSNIEIRSYPLILGDNPECRFGPPTALHWNFIDKEIRAIDDVDPAQVWVVKDEPPKKTQPLSFLQRKRILIASGFTKQEIVEAIQRVKMIRKQRRQSYLISFIDYAPELIAKTAKKLFFIPNREKDNPNEQNYCCFLNSLPPRVCNNLFVEIN